MRDHKLYIGTGNDTWKARHMGVFHFGGNSLWSEIGRLAHSSGVCPKTEMLPRHIAANPHVSVTIPIAKHIPLMPWFKIPAATITFSGTARILEAAETPTELLQAVFRDLANNEHFLTGTCLIEVTPEKEFVTYGVGIPLMQMRYPEKARGRAPAASPVQKEIALKAGI